MRLALKGGERGDIELIMSDKEFSEGWMVFSATANDIL